MSSSSPSSKSSGMPKGPAAWSRLLANSAASEGGFLHTVALLGILRMLDERDAAERAGWEFEGRQVSRPPMPSFEEVWKTWLPADVKRWCEEYEGGGYARWDTSTRDLRHQLAPLMDLSKQGVDTVSPVLHLLDAFDPTQKQTFAEWFRHHLEELIWSMEEERITRGSSPSWALQELLRDLCPLQPHHRVLLAGFNSAQLLTELMGKIRALARYTPKGRLTNTAMHGVSVRTNSGSFALVAWAILLAHEVELPDVRHESPTALIAEPVYDCVLVSPPWGLTTHEPDYTLPIRTNRVESILLLHALKALRSGGRLIAWLPRAMARVTTEEELRQWLLQTQHLAAVVELPGEAVNRRGLSSMLLLLANQPPGEQVFFAGEALVKRCFEDWENAPLHPQLKLLAQLLRTSMGAASDDDARAFREDTMKVNPVYAEERDEMLALGRNLTNGTPPPDAGPRFCELRSGVLPLKSWRGQGTEFSWPRDFDSGLQRSLRLLAGANPMLRLTTLQEVAEIVKGVSYTRERTMPAAEVRAPDRSRHVGIIRVSDLSRKMDPDVHLPFCQDPALLLTEAAAAELSDRHYLKPWDILLSSAGTVDKVSVFASEEQRCVAAQQIIIIRPIAGHESKTIRHIVGLLVSEAGKAWLRSLATGSVIQHLLLRDLREMPMIDGPDTLLDAIGEHLLHGHPLETASSVFDDGLRQDPTLAFFSQCDAMRLTFAPESANAVEAWLGNLSSALQTWKESFHDVIPKGRLHDWWTEVDALIHRLLRGLKTNPGYDRLTLLLFWQHTFVETEKALATAVERFTHTLEESTVPNADDLQKEGITHRGKTLLRRMGELAATEIGRQCQTVKLHVKLEPQEVTVATQTVVTVELVNLSPLSLQDVVLSVNDSRTHAKLLANVDAIKLPVVVHAAYAGPLSMQVQWKARTLDGREFTGVIVKQVNVVSLRTASAPQQLNPYVDGGSPVGGRDKMFYGRKEALRRMDQAFARGNRTTVLIIEGNRRIGKSSLMLYYRMHRLDLEKWLPVEINFQSFGTATSGERKKVAGIPDRRIFQGIAKRLLEAASEAGVEVPVAGFGRVSAGLPPEVQKMLLSELEAFFNEGDPFERFLHILNATLAVIGEMQLLLMFDEFDLIQAGIDSGVTGSQVPENFRHLLQAYPQLSAVLTGSLKIRRLRQQYWNVLFNLGQSLQLRGLEPAEAAELVTEPVKGNLTYAPEAVKEIVNLTGRQPLLIQTLCGRLFEMCEDRKVVLITLPMVQEAAQEQVEESETFARLWDDIGHSRQRALTLVMEQMTRTDRAVRPVLLRELAEEQGLRFESHQQFTSDIDTLKDQDVLSSRIEDQTESLAFEVPLFALWLRRHQDFASVCAKLAEADD